MNGEERQAVARTDIAMERLLVSLKQERDRYKEALERILNIRVQDKPIHQAWREARQAAFDAFCSNLP